MQLRVNVPEKTVPQRSRQVWLVIAATLFFHAEAHAQRAVSSCIDAAAVLPLLGGNGDSPLIPVKIGASPAAMFVSPALNHVFIRDHDALWFPSGTPQKLRAQDGNIVEARRTEIETLEIGKVFLTKVPALLLDGNATHSAGRLPVLGLIGRNLLAHTEVLLDVPNGKIAFFQWHTGKGCSGTPDSIFSGTVYDVPMDSDGGIRMKIDNTSARLQLDPDLALSVLPRSDAHSAGVTDKALSQDPHVTTRYSAITVGARHRFRAVSIGEDTLAHFDFVVQDTIQSGALGGNFFEGVVALFDFPHGRFIFQPTDVRNTAPVLHLHFDESHQSYTSVHETPGIPEH